LILKRLPGKPHKLLFWISLFGLLSSSCGREEDIIFGYRTLELGGKEIRVALALTPAQRERGLKFRSALPPNEGMLFVFPEPVRHPFWMKDTVIPLSIAFLDREGRIIDILEMEPLNEEKLYRPGQPYLYALEMNRGWFERNGNKIGDRVILDR
jgi:uncharacterized membrane protein (UPF0127 family)